ncbi:AAA family ATPase [Mesorhizobium sp. M0862]|uniref:AAA family ATPase n=1 Tax=Mesorhizobium sp. M0862 TaxID=2957015 RepID=UPI0033360247
MTHSPEQLLESINATRLVGASAADAGEQRPALKWFASHEFTSMTLKPRDFILEPIIRTGSLAMLSAFRGVGKTQVAIGIAHAAATGGAFLNWRAPVPRDVLYVDGEMPGADLQERLRMFSQVSSGRLRILPMDEQEIGVSLNLSQTESQERLEAILGPTELLILDNRSTLTSGGRENEAESWDTMQSWQLKLRRRGVSVLLIEHEGRGGNPRGTSKREDVLDTLITLKHPDDYSIEDGARFEVHLGKARGVFGEAAKPFEAKLEIRDGEAQWTVKDLQDVEADLVMTMTGDGASVRDIAAATGLSKSKVNRIQARSKATQPSTSER